jgi:4-hydroxybenzoate polyprenyltransferase
MIKTPRQKTFWAIFLLPFVFSAAIQFLPVWLSVPIAFLCGSFWIGAVCVLAKLPPKEKNENTRY